MTKKGSILREEEIKVNQQKVKSTSQAVPSPFDKTYQCFAQGWIANTTMENTRQAGC